MPDYLIYIVPVAVIVILFIVMMPIIKKKSAGIQAGMLAIQNKNVHITMMAGGLDSVNGVSSGALVSVNNIFGIDDAGMLALEFTPSFTYAETHYQSSSPMKLQFEAKDKGSYQIEFAAKEPKNDSSVILVTPIVNKKIIFKTTFYIVVRDVTGTRDANVMRGIM